MSDRQTWAELNALKNCKILIIEDNTYVREAFELTLIKTGLNAKVLTTGEEALRAVRQQNFDVIISDYQLPGMDGIQFFEKASRLTPHATKALISSYGFDDIVESARAVGVKHFFNKPFSIHEILLRLNLSQALSTQNISMLHDPASITRSP